mgnify:CR=1 FL=1
MYSVFHSLTNKELRRGSCGSCVVEGATFTQVFRRPPAHTLYSEGNSFPGEKFPHWRGTERVFATALYVLVTSFLGGIADPPIPAVCDTKLLPSCDT